MSVFTRIRSRYATDKATGKAKSMKEIEAHLKQIHIDGEREVNERVNRVNRETRMNHSIGRSGIHARHQSCKLSNYQVSCEGQSEAKFAATFYVDNFDGKSGFIFHGTPGTGKNHLASAIGMELINQGCMVLVVTASEILSLIYDTYSRKDKSEQDVIEDLCKVDLLVIDEIGRASDKGRAEKERYYLDEVVDRRQKKGKAIGMLTNLSLVELQEFIGYRVIDRMMEDKPVIREFNWGSFRTKQ